MKATITFGDQLWNLDFSKPIDVSIPLINGAEGPNCFFAPLYAHSPVEAENFVGDTRQGSPVNFYNIALNPHGNGTHTECVGHISTDRVSINETFKRFHFLGQLITVWPQLQTNGDSVINHHSVENVALVNDIECLIVRTMPNAESKMRKNYSGTNPPYFSATLLDSWSKLGIQHLVVDLPSVDREIDGGLVLGHKAWWNFPDSQENTKSISEFVYVPDQIKDGMYLVEFQFPPMTLDAAPSRIVLYQLEKQR